MSRNLPSNLWESPVIRKRLVMEAQFEGNYGKSPLPFFWVFVPQADSGKDPMILKNFAPTPKYVEPHILQQEFARNLMDKLMTEAHHNGLWLVGWTHPPVPRSIIDLQAEDDNCWGRLIFIWHDKDGDPQYTMESEFDFTQMLQAGENYYVNLAQDAHQKWREIYSDRVLKADMSLRDDQQKTAALDALRRGH